jgi:hypothetical protein
MRTLSRFRRVSTDWPLVCTTRNYTLQITDTYRLVSSVWYSLLWSCPGNGFYWGRFFSVQVLLSQPPSQNSCLLTTQLIGSQAGGHFTPCPSLLFTGFQPTTDNWLTHNQLLHVTSLNWTVENFNSGIQLTLLITFRHEPHIKHRFHCYSTTIPLQWERDYRPLLRNGYLFIRLLYSNGTACYNIFHLLSPENCTIDF